MREARALELIVALSACLVLSTVAPATAQPDVIGETVDVRVVNVDVIATDDHGKPLSGLKRADFRLLVNGSEVPVEYFSAFEAIESPDPADSRAPDPDAGSLPLVIVNYDARFSRPGTARHALESLRGKLGELLQSTRAIMVARQGMSLVI